MCSCMWKLRQCLQSVTYTLLAFGSPHLRFLCWPNKNDQCKHKQLTDLLVDNIDMFSLSLFLFFSLFLSRLLYSSPSPQILKLKFNSNLLSLYLSISLFHSHSRSYFALLQHFWTRRYWWQANINRNRVFARYICAIFICVHTANECNTTRVDW